MIKLSDFFPTNSRAAQSAARENFQKNEKSLIVERVRGIEPPSIPWEGIILPLNHTRILACGLDINYIILKSVFYPIKCVFKTGNKRIPRIIMRS